MNYRILGLILIILLPSLSNAQSSRWKRYRYEVFYGFGAANFLGDLGGKDQIGTPYFADLEMSMTRPAAQIGMRYKFTPLLAGSMAITAGMVAGDDNTTREEFREPRQLHFRSPIVEVSTRFEFMFLKERAGHRYNLRGVKGIKKLELYPYGFFGVGGFWFNPKAQAPNGKWIALQPLGTEGQTLIPTRTPYKRFQVSIPAGIGFKYAIDRRWLIGIEYGIRKTFTDYIDDVSTTYVDNNLLLVTEGTNAAYFADPSGGWLGSSPGMQRGDPTDDDSYMFITLTLNYKLRTTRGNLPKFKG